MISDVAKISVGHTRNIKEEFETNGKGYVMTSNT
jgi:hypothetical protein